MSETFVSNWRLMKVDPRIFAIWVHNLRVAQQKKQNFVKDEEMS